MVPLPSNLSPLVFKSMESREGSKGTSVDRFGLQVSNGNSLVPCVYVRESNLLEIGRVYRCFYVGKQPSITGTRKNKSNARVGEEV